MHSGLKLPACRKHIGEIEHHSTSNTNTCHSSKISVKLSDGDVTGGDWRCETAPTIGASQAGPTTTPRKIPRPSRLRPEWQRSSQSHSHSKSTSPSAQPQCRTVHLKRLASAIHTGIWDDDKMRCSARSTMREYHQGAGSYVWLHRNADSHRA